MKVPFSEEQFLAVFGQYNDSLETAVAILWIGTAAVVLFWLTSRRPPDRTIAALLAIEWGWTGLVYHFGFFTRINPAAWIFGALSLIQAGLFAWFGVVRTQLHFSSKPTTAWTALAWAFVVYSLLYPLVGLAAGFHPPRMPTFGVPCPTTLLTAGFLLSVRPRPHRVLFIIPLLWSVIGGSAAILFRVYQDWPLMLAGSALILFGLLERSLTMGRRLMVSGNE